MMERRKLGKKGGVSDIFVLLIIVTFLAISFIAVLIVNTELRGVISDTELNTTTASPAILDSFDNVNGTVVQRGFVIFFALLIVGVMVSSFLIRVHPAFMFLYIIVLVVTLFTAVYMGNLYSDFTDNDTIAAVAEDQTMINFVMDNIVKITLAVGALSMIIVFSKIFTGPGLQGSPDL